MSCTSLVADCDINEVSLDGFCWKTDSKGTGFVTQEQDIDHPVIEQSVKPTLWDCANACKNNTNCKGLWWNTHSGSCSLKGDGPTNDSSTLTSEDNGECTVVLKKVGTDMCIDGKCLTTKRDEKQVGKIISKRGGECRKKILSGKISSNIAEQQFSKFCQLYPDMKICRDWCKQGNCSDNKYLKLIIGGAALGFGLLAGGLLYRKFIVVVLGLTLIAGTAIVYFKTNGTPYSGNKPDFAVPESTPMCAKMYYSCINPMAPEGKRCQVSNNNTGILGKSNCEKGGCCPPGTESKNGKCWQYQQNLDAKFEANHTEYSIGHMYCPIPLQGGNIPQPHINYGNYKGGCFPTQSVRKGDYYCEGGANPKWMLCSSESGCRSSKPYLAPNMYYPGWSNQWKHSESGKLRWCPST